MAVEYLLQACWILDAANLGVKDDAGEIAGKLQSQVEKRRFGNLVTDDRRRAKARHLAANLRAYGPRGACDQNGLCPQSGRNALMLEIDRGPSQQVLHRNVANLSCQAGLFDNFSQPGNCL